MHWSSLSWLTLSWGWKVGVFLCVPFIYFIIIIIIILLYIDLFLLEISIILCYLHV